MCFYKFVLKAFREEALLRKEGSRFIESVHEPVLGVHYSISQESLQPLELQAPNEAVEGALHSDDLINLNTSVEESTDQQQQEPDQVIVDIDTNVDVSSSHLEESASRGQQEGQKEKESRNLDVAEANLRDFLEKQPNNPRILHSLAAILEKKELLLQAFDIVTNLITAVPENKQYSKTHERLKEMLNGCTQKIDPIEEKKRIVTVRMVAEAERIVARKVKEEEKRIDAAKQVATSETTMNLLPSVIHTWSDGKKGVPPIVHTQIISTQGGRIAKPLFNSDTEKAVYKVLVEQFPNCLTYPNIALQSLFYFKHMKEVLNGEDFEYYLKAHVDFGIIRPSDYTTVVAIELDSSYHDEENIIEKDEVKNHLFRLAGIDLLRLRPLKKLTSDRIREEVIALVQAWRLQCLEHR